MSQTPAIDMYQPARTDGTIDNIFEGKDQLVTPQGHVCYEDLSVKVYSCFPHDDKQEVENQKLAIYHLMAQGHITPQKLENGTLIREGFSIISDETMNTVIWGNGLPILNKQFLFQYDPQQDNHKVQEALANEFQTEPKYLPSDPNHEGSYCTYETQILATESILWMQYLNHFQEEGAKETYLQTFCEGTIDTNGFRPEYRQIPLSKQD